MKCESCDLKFTAATSNLRQCWVMLSDRVRVKLPSRQLAKHSIALRQTKLNMCKCLKQVVLRLLRQASKSRKRHDSRGWILHCFLCGKQTGLFSMRRQKALMDFVERNPSLRQQADGRTEGRARKEGELRFWEDHWSPTRPLPLFDGKQKDYKAIMNNWHLNASHCPQSKPPPQPNIHRGPEEKCNFSPLNVDAIQF